MPEAAEQAGPGSDGNALPRTGNPATDAALALLTQLVRQGLTHLVLSPGSRSQALALVAAELERVGAIELHVRIDERVGGFLALGIAAETGHPAAIVTTSGTATANLLPAVLEAHHSNLPMLVLTADRPAQLRGIRSNQTTVQAGMYGAAVRRALDVAAPTGADGEADAFARLARQAWSASLDETGPVHLNLAFREPLSVAVPDLSGFAADVNARDDGAAESPKAALAHPAALARENVILSSGPRTVVIAGNAAGPDAEELARAAGWPLIAEASSGSRYGPNLVVAYRQLLRDAGFGGQVQRAVVFGHPTLSREVPALLQRDDVEVVVVAPVGEEVYDPSRSARVAASARVEDADPNDRAARAWVGRWVFASRALLEEDDAASADHIAPDVEAGRSHTPEQRLAFAKAEFAAVRAPVTRRMLVEALWRFTWPHDRLVLGASRLVRDLDGAVPGKKIRVHANRGLAGIDGTVSTAIGMALAAQPQGAETPTGTTRVLLGDLAMLHDAGSLLFGEGERRPTVQVVVGNDGGGTIFDSLEVASTAPAEAMRRVLTTPQRVDLAALAGAYGWSYRLVQTRGELDQALSAPPAGTSIVEVPLPR
ncbi:2-succinyl-5-enolpyruvyl-6-hydroxy-3-cyclohexene-1-carboxylic-acid synthase [Humibacter sp.]|jgi:2-succinyl-5-enolpyruvyl-6-hydroxy-3-cyclohexene-1-carboxylate synthase|uniref:2-succinyl-5-enolpyruvyl-6-hydroxy-3- cyclohexene-1-carboxylic-acid synthase n=1 Tax=Humibacter sp. TaxID=1940291 RepID=UPI002CDDE7BC|nr:2-succinyl-5-enolpyruvyl-6-hydroxy-3-cyclohexene-1-carboxylic-acid synthase [Humibacter sp.]HVX07429.1 2-succinyl-5-enolpyruvyl-6-hydroxy-3-cyclohexene-1-carboxylic-acid synthase [Humibacter sp.]